VAGPLPEGSEQITIITQPDRTGKQDPPDGQIPHPHAVRLEAVAQPFAL
jgi:hypothetical protein